MHNRTYTYVLHLPQQGFRDRFNMSLTVGAWTSVSTPGSELESVELTYRDVDEEEVSRRGSYSPEVEYYAKYTSGEEEFVLVSWNKP